MSKTLAVAAGALFFLFTGTGCGGRSEQTGTAEPAKTGAGTLPLTPTTGSSEHYVSPLAQLMRDMTAFADSTKQHLSRGEDLLPYPAAFKGMLTAEATPGMMDHRTFDPFAFSYLHQLDSLYHVVPERRQAAFDELVQFCAACHGQVCPGPLVRIKKLRMPPAAE
jgi:hypothetical protein